MYIFKLSQYFVFVFQDKGLTIYNKKSYLTKRKKVQMHGNLIINIIIIIIGAFVLIF